MRCVNLQGTLKRKKHKKNDFFTNNTVIHAIMS